MIWKGSSARTVLVTALLGLLSVSQARTLYGEDWPSLLGPGRDGRSAETGALAPWSAGGPELLWQRPTGEGYSAPAVVGGRLYFFDRDDDEVRISCLDAASGKEIWVQRASTVYSDYYGYSNGPRASPVVDGDRVYTFGVDGWLRCHDVQNGDVLWQVDTGTEFGVVQNFFGAGSTPVVEGDLLLVQVGGSPIGSPGVHSGKVTSNSSAIVAFDKRSGRVRYQAGDELASYASPIVASIDGRRLGLLFARGGLLGFDPSDGAVGFEFAWKARRLQSVNAATPVVVGDEVFLTEAYGLGGVLLRVSHSGYEVVWQDPPTRAKSLASHWSTPVYHQGHLYGSSGEHSAAAELRCVEWASGRVRWREPGLKRCTLLYFDGRIAVLSEYGELLVVEARSDSFKPIERATLSDASGRPLLRYPAWSPPVLSNGALYLLGGGRLVALRLLLPATVGKP